MADERGAFGGGQPGEWTPSVGPNPGAGSAAGAGDAVPVASASRQLTPFPSRGMDPGR